MHASLSHGQQQPRPSTTATDPNRLVNSADIRQRFGGISDMTLWRWSQNPALGFPKPVYINRRRFWRLADIDAWIARQEVIDHAA